MFFCIRGPNPPQPHKTQKYAGVQKTLNAPLRNETGRSPSCPQTTPVVDDIRERLRSSLHLSGLESVGDSVFPLVPKPRVPGQLGLQGAASGLEVARVPGRTAVLRVKAADGLRTESVFSTESIGKAQTCFILNKHTSWMNSAKVKVDYQRLVAAQQHVGYLLSFNINSPKSSLEQGPSKVTAGRMTSNVNEWEGLTGERTLGEGQQLHSVAEILQQVSRLEQRNSPLPSHATSSSSSASFTDCSTAIWGMVLWWW